MQGYSYSVRYRTAQDCCRVRSEDAVELLFYLGNLRTLGIIHTIVVPVPAAHSCVSADHAHMTRQGRQQIERKKKEPGAVAPDDQDAEPKPRTLRVPEVVLYHISPNTGLEGSEDLFLILRPTIDL